MIEVFLSAMGEQRVQQVLPTPMFCILHNSLIVKFQKFLHTPKSTYTRIHYMNWMSETKKTDNYILKRNSGMTEFWVTYQPVIGFTGSTKRRYDTLLWMLSWSVNAVLVCSPAGWVTPLVPCPQKENDPPVPVQPPFSGLPFAQCPV